MLTGYKRVPLIAPASDDRACLGCAFCGDDEYVATVECEQMQRLGPENHRHPDHWCPTTIWIKDTPEGIAEYMALRLTTTV